MGNENAPAFVGPCGNLNINYVLHQLDHNKSSGILRSKITGQPSCRVKMWGGTLDMLREFRNSVG